MNILVIGGTGAMGVPLVRMLSQAGNSVYVTSRRRRDNFENVFYLCGDGHDRKFMESVLSNYEFDVIVDFMIYTLDELKNNINYLITNTRHYIFLSSCRVLSDSNQLITENTKRFLDSSDDTDFLNSSEYALEKAKEEDIIFQLKENNWTIIRPYITYNRSRLQLGVYEKEHWLNRALSGKAIVWPEDLGETYTTLTFGDDVALILSRIVGDERTFGEIYNVSSEQYVKWNDILGIYDNCFFRKTGKYLNIKHVKNSEKLMNIWWNPWQLKYDRLLNRRFDCKKVQNIIGSFNFTDVYYGLDKCLSDFIESPSLGIPDIKFEGWSDKISNSKIDLKNINGLKNKMKYLKWRLL